MAKALIEVLGERLGKRTTLIDLYRLQRDKILDVSWHADLIDLIITDRVEKDDNGIYLINPVEIVQWRKKNES